MKKLFATLTACVMVLCATAFVAAQPTLSTVTVVGGSREVLDFRKTVTLARVQFTGSEMRITSAGAEGWPSVAIEDGGEPVQAGTLWIFENINNQWYAAGAERLRPTQVNGSKPEGPIADLIGDGMLYDEGRWGKMAHYNPKIGEMVCFMLASGSTRSDSQFTVRERSNVLCQEWGTDRVLWAEGDTVVPPVGPPVPPVVPPAGTYLTDGDLIPLRGAIANLQEQINRLPAPVDTTELQNQLNDLNARLSQLEAKKIPVGCDVKASLFGFNVSVGCKLY